MSDTDISAEPGNVCRKNLIVAYTALALYDRGHAILIKHFPEQSEHPTVFRMRRALARAYSGEPRLAVAELRAIVAAFAKGKYASPSRPLSLARRAGQGG